MSWLCASGRQGTGASASVLPMNIQGWFLLALTGLISWSSRDSQDSSPSSQFKSINFSALSLLYGPTFISVHDHWKNHGFDYMDLCWQTEVSNMMSMFIIAFLPGSRSLNFMTAFTIPSDFGAQENKICHCFHFPPFYLPWSDGTGCYDLRFLNVEFEVSLFTLLFHLHQEAL